MKHTDHRQRQRGQAFVMFTLFAAILLGMLGLVLDIGWTYYLTRKAQTATDTAALAAARIALRQLPPDEAPSCGRIECQSETACPGNGNLQAGCRYANANGFSHGGDGGRQSLFVAASTTPIAPGVPHVESDYWVQVRAEQRAPKWFSGAFLQSALLTGTRSTAALRRTKASASLYLLNRSNDCFVSLGGLGLVCGEDFLALGSNELNAGGGIYMASSNKQGLGLPRIAAATVLGNLDVNAPFTYLMGEGAVQTILGDANWNTAPVNGLPDNEFFADPMAGKGQPPVPTGLPDHPVPGGIIVGSLFPNNPTVLPPGHYYATTPSLPILGLRTPTGLPVVITGNVVFSDGSPTPCGGFCNYVFHGGIVTGALSTVTFAPGRYVFAGAMPVSGGPGVALTLGANAKIQDMTPLSGGEITRNTDAGEIFIFTDSDYAGLQLPLNLTRAGMRFPQAKAGIATGLNPRITLHGLNRDNASLPHELARFAPALIWQDQANSSFEFSSNGHLDLGCNGPCTRVLDVPGSQEMILTASQYNGRAGTQLYGLVYSPRGAWTTILGILPGDTISGPMQLVTGALQMTLNSSLDLKALPNPPSILVASLIE